MSTSQTVFSIIIFVISIISFVFAFCQYKEKGVLLNNAYIYASKEERQKMNKKPYYKQSSIVLLFIGMLFLVSGLGIVTDSSWFFPVTIVLVILLIVYVIASTVRIATKKK